MTKDKQISSFFNQQEEVLPNDVIEMEFDDFLLNEEGIKQRCNQTNLRKYLSINQINIIN